MEKINLYEAGPFDENHFKHLLIHDSPYFKILNFNFKAGQEMPIHSHDLEGEVCLYIMDGQGLFLGADDVEIKARKGDIWVCPIREPHGLRAETDLRLLVTIAPPI